MSSEEPTEENTTVVSSDGFQSSRLHIACWNDDRETVEQLCKAGISPNTRDSEGKTPIYSACLYGFEDMVLLLLSLGAEFEIRSDDGSTPLTTALRWKSTSVAVLLVQQGASIDRDSILIAKKYLDRGQLCQFRKAVFNSFATALFMGLHERLGSSSSVMLLPGELLHAILCRAVESLFMM